MNNGNLIHVRLEYEEALQSKKYILSSEMNLLKIIKIIKKYHSLRLEELKLKLRVYRKLKEASAEIRRLQKTFLNTEGLEILEKDEIGRKIKKTKENQYDKSLESQLQEIQEKLDALQRK